MIATPKPHRSLSQRQPWNKPAANRRNSILWPTILRREVPVLERVFVSLINVIKRPSRMSEKEPTVQRLNQRARDQIGQQLRHYYGSCIGEKLPPRLLAVLKKLDEEMESKQEHTSATINTSEPPA
jgi:hypothetical protein